MLVIDSCQSGGALDVLERVASAKAWAASRSATTAARNAVGVTIAASATSLDLALQPRTAGPDGREDLGKMPDALVTTVERAVARGEGLTASRLLTVMEQAWSAQAVTGDASPVAQRIGIDFVLLPAHK